MQTSREPSIASRRDWLRGAARTAVLGGLGLGTAWLVARKEQGEAGGCPRALACSGCPLFHGCTLPARVRMGAREELHD